MLFISTHPLPTLLLPATTFFHLLIDIHYRTLRLHNPLRAVLRYKSGISRSSSATRHRHRPDRLSLSLSRGLSSQTLSCWVSERQPKQKNERRLRTLRHRHRYQYGCIFRARSVVVVVVVVVHIILGPILVLQRTATRIQVDPFSSPSTSCCSDNLDPPDRITSLAYPYPRTPSIPISIPLGTTILSPYQTLYSLIHPHTRLPIPSGRKRCLVQVQVGILNPIGYRRRRHRRDETRRRRGRGRLTRISPFLGVSG